MLAEITLEYRCDGEERPAEKHAIEVRCVTELSNIAYNLLCTSHADLVNFQLVKKERL